jgi:hypothetical protein
MVLPGGLNMPHATAEALARSSGWAVWLRFCLATVVGRCQSAVGRDACRRAHIAPWLPISPQDEIAAEEG